MPIELSQEAFTAMVIIKVKDDLTHQVLLLTPQEALNLRDTLNSTELSGTDPDSFCERESKTMRELTLYNGHSLPTINRRQFEVSASMHPCFDFEVYQRIRNAAGEIVEKREVGTL